jgi:hypothetical protein
MSLLQREFEGAIPSRATIFQPRTNTKIKSDWFNQLNEKIGGGLLAGLTIYPFNRLAIL